MSWNVFLDGGGNLGVVVVWWLLWYVWIMCGGGLVGMVCCVWFVIVCIWLVWWGLFWLYVCFWWVVLFGLGRYRVFVGWNFVWGSLVLLWCLCSGFWFVLGYCFCSVWLVSGIFVGFCVCLVLGCVWGWWFFCWGWLFGNDGDVCGLWFCWWCCVFWIVLIGFWVWWWRFLFFVCVLVGCCWLVCVGCDWWLCDWSWVGWLVCFWMVFGGVVVRCLIGFGWWLFVWFVCKVVLVFCWVVRLVGNDWRKRMLWRDFLLRCWWSEFMYCLIVCICIYK